MYTNCVLYLVHFICFQYTNNIISQREIKNTKENTKEKINT